MTTPEPIKQKLLSSPAVVSLQAEQVIANRLSNLGWSVNHGAFYRDLVTGKIRETDVLASTLASGRSGKREKIISLRLFVEVKTIRDYHIVFAPTTDFVDTEQGNYEWIGWHTESMLATLDSHNLTADDFAHVMQTFRSEFPFPLSERVAKFLLPPPPQQFHTGSFRETNIGGEKDLDSSVFWKAAASLESAIVADKHAEIELNKLELARLIGQARRRRQVVHKQIGAYVKQTADHFMIYHPIVVVDSRLWIFRTGEIDEIDACRFHRVGNWPVTWVDVVTSSQAHDFLKNLTLHYQSAFGRHRLR